MTISVIICTHNPRRDYLERVLEGLRFQTLEQSAWEIVVIDNRSVPPLINDWDLGWHQNARIVSEETLGLTPARLRGIKESKGELLVFVDDDNILNDDYLNVARSLANDHRELGAFGGKALPSYEIHPQEDLRSLADAVALARPLEGPLWSNLYKTETTPFGAGLCVRREVAKAYLQSLAVSPGRQSLDKTGSALVLCGDTDLAWTAIDIGMGCGVFPELHFNHLVPASRTTADYLLRAVEGFWCSWVLLHRMRRLPLDSFLPFQDRSSQALWWWRYLRQSRVSRQTQRALWRGQWRGAKQLL